MQFSAQILKKKWLKKSAFDRRVNECVHNQTQAKIFWRVNRLKGIVALIVIESAHTRKLILSSKKTGRVA